MNTLRVKSALMFGAIVAIKLKEDYGLTLDTYPSGWWLETLFHKYEEGLPSHDVAFIVAGIIQREGKS